MTYDPAVEAYRAAYRATRSDHPAWQAALATFMKQHPDIATGVANNEVAQMIADASTADPERFWGS